MNARSREAAKFRAPTLVTCCLHARPAQNPYLVLAGQSLSGGRGVHGWHRPHRNFGRAGFTRDQHARSHGDTVEGWAQTTSGQVGEGRNHEATLGVIRERTRSGCTDHIGAISLIRTKTGEADRQFPRHEAPKEHFTDSFEDNVTVLISGQCCP
jgi:hypothetical protein